MKKSQKNKKEGWFYRHRTILGIATIVITLYLLITAGMSLIEAEKTKQAEMNILFLEALSIAGTPAEKEHLLLLYHRLSKDDTSLLQRTIIRANDAINDITIGEEHCSSEDSSNDCTYYNQDTLNSITQIEQRLLRKQTFTQPKQISFLDHALRALTLILEALIPASLITYWRQIKRKIWK